MNVVLPARLEDYLAERGEVFVDIRGHDSRNTSYGVVIDGERLFVKHAADAKAIRLLESAVRFHQAVRHPRIIPLVGTITSSDGLAVVHPWRDGEVLSDAYPPTAASALPRDDPASTFARFRALPLDTLLNALEDIYDAHVTVSEAGFVAVDFYDGAVISDFERDEVHLCDLDLYRPGPYVLDVDRQFGSTRFMAPEEFRRGATIDDRTTVFTLGRTAFVMLSSGLRGESDRDLWGASQALFDVATHATQQEPEDRHQSVSEFVTAWRNAR